MIISTQINMSIHVFVYLVSICKNFFHVYLSNKLVMSVSSFTERFILQYSLGVTLALV